MGIRIRCENGFLSISLDLDIFNMDKKCFVKINIETSPPVFTTDPESGSPSLIMIKDCIIKCYYHKLIENTNLAFCEFFI